MSVGGWLKRAQRQLIETDAVSSLGGAQLHRMRLSSAAAPMSSLYERRR